MKTVKTINIKNLINKLKNKSNSEYENCRLIDELALNRSYEK